MGVAWKDVQALMTTRSCQGNVRMSPSLLQSTLLGLVKNLGDGIRLLNLDSGDPYSTPF